MQELNVKKSSTFGSIAVYSRLFPFILKDCVDFCLVHLTYSVNLSLKNKCFPTKVKKQQKLFHWVKN